ncbi:hypothetical protein IEQ34_018876 [Dendrobium chrysotoxum]|uniref:Uncharacterized protein n=1 Tax=Dendrobium chrysotoxum TaxID=161865 RepID=A0AAV7G7V1_DENCH|nr:hypothetical protein IEQ34_018876 [Dendrobium chrysotoxum]
MLLHKNFHIPNDVVTTVPKRSDRASLPHPGYLTVSETSLRTGLRFPPSAELVEILRRCGVCLSQFSYRAMSVIVGLIALFRDRGAVIHLSTFRGWDDLLVICRGGKLRDLPAPLHVGVKDIMRLLKVSDVKHLLYEVHYLNKYIEEEFLFKVGLSFHLRRSDAWMLKLTSKVPEPPVPVPKAASKRQVGGEDPKVLLKKKKLEEVAANTGKVAPVSSPVKIRVPGDVLSHQCVGRRKDDDLLSRRIELEAELTGALNEWNAEFVKIKYLQGEFKRKYDQKTREAKVLEEELCGCRIELANIVQSVSLQNQQIDHLLVDLERAQATITQLQVKALEQQCLDDGFIRGFLKGVRLMQRKTGVEVEGLTPSQASDDFPLGSDGDEIESELQKAFALEADDEVVDIE